MKWKMMVAILVAAAPLMSQAAENPNRKLPKQCESAQGEVKKECEEVARKMMSSSAADGRPDKTDSDVTHSGPAMEAEPPSAKPKPATNKQPKPKPDKPDASE